MGGFREREGEREREREIERERERKGERGGRGGGLEFRHAHVLPRKCVLERGGGGGE